MLAGVSYFAADVMGDPNSGPTYLFVAFVGPALAVMPLWSRVGRRTGRQQSGVFTGLWTAGETLGLALGPGIFAGVLQLSGYVSTSAGETVSQPSGVRDGIVLGFTVVPVLLVAAALFPFRRYDLTENQLATVRLNDSGSRNT